MAIQVKQRLMFSTSLFEAKISDVVDIERIIRNARLIRKSDPGGKKTNRGGWQSKYFAVGEESDPYMKEVFDSVIYPLANPITAKRFGISIDAAKCEYWYNMNYPRNYNVSHHHFPAKISGAFYLRLPRRAGRIVFERSMFETVAVEFFNPKVISSDSCSEYFVDPKVGDLLLFPSYAIHRVEENLSDVDHSGRISVAFNYT